MLWTVHYIDPDTGILTERDIEARDEREAANICALRVIGHTHGPLLQVMHVEATRPQRAIDS